MDIIALRNSGTIPSATLDIFDSIKDFCFSSSMIEHENFVCDAYKYYIEYMMEMPSNEQQIFLNLLKKFEILDNHSLEGEDTFLVHFYREVHLVNDIDILLSNDFFTRTQFVNGHKILLKGTKGDEYASRDHRISNTTYVGAIYPNGNIGVDYFPIDCDLIEEAIFQFLSFYNSDIYDKHLFLKSLMIHGIIAGLQMFDDGNTRYARLLQNIKLYDLTLKNFGYDFSTPVFYNTKTYFQYRGQYRDFIRDLILAPIEENWEKWFHFNLNRCEDQINFLMHKIENYKKLVR